MKSFLVKLIVLFFTVPALTGCYEDYLLITSNYKSVVVSADSNTVFFFHFLKAVQPPKGISRLPDGGSYKTVYKNVKVFSYHLKTGELKSIHDFGTIPFNQVLDHIAVQNDNIVFSLSPLIRWDWIKKHNPDSIYKSLYNEYTGFYKYNISNKTLNRFVYNGFYPQLSPDNKQIVYLKRDSVQLSIWHLDIYQDINQKLKSLNVDAPYKPIIWKDSTSIYYKTQDSVNLLAIRDKTVQITNSGIDFYPNKFPVSKIREMTSKFTFEQWGFNLKRHFNKSNQQYINDIVMLNGNFNYRKAIIEVISNEISSDDILNMINGLEEHQNKLQGSEKMKYEIIAKDTKDELKKLLNE